MALAERDWLVKNLGLKKHELHSFQVLRNLPANGMNKDWVVFNLLLKQISMLQSKIEICPILEG